MICLGTKAKVIILLSLGLINLRLKAMLRIVLMGARNKRSRSDYDPKNLSFFFLALELLPWKSGF